MKPTKVEYLTDGPEKEEENAKRESIDSQIRCPKCQTGKLTKHIHKMLPFVTDANMEKWQLTQAEVFKMFGIVDKSIVEAKHQKYTEAQKETEAQLEKDVAKYKKAV